MNGRIEVVSGSLPLFAQLLGLLLSSIVAFVALRRCQDWSSKFVIFAIWFRFILSAFPSVTYQTVAAGLSGNALGSIFIVALGLFTARRKIIFNVIALAIAPYLISIIISSSINHNLMGSVDTILKTLYFFVIATHIFNIFRNGYQKKFSFWALFAFCPLIIFQALSVALGSYKQTEADGSASYIGGYNHEAAFSSALVGLVMLSVLGQGLSTRTRWAGMTTGVVGIFIANYRTAIIAAGPIIVYFVLSEAIRQFPRHLKAFVLLVSALFAITATVGISVSTDRLDDLPKAIERVANGLGRPESFTFSDRRILSGRLYLWSKYIDEWQQSDNIRHLVGFGPDSYQQKFTIYAHNTFVHNLYEYGIFGLIAVIFMFACGFIVSILGSGENRIKIVFAQLSFLVLNMSTMPLWQIEGLITWAIIWGWSASFYAGPARRHQSRSQR
jgi:hypothetical protein